MKINMKIGMVLVLLLGVVFSVNAELSDSKAITISLVNQDPDPSIAGNIVEIRLGVENVGGKAAENLIIELEPEYPFTMVPGEEAIQKIGTMKAYQTGSDMKIVKFKLRVDRDATAGGYELKIKEYEEGKTIIMVTHDLKLARYAHTTIELKDGQIIKVHKNIK